MFCPRLDHFVRLNPNGTVSRCGHMVQGHQFASLSEMDHSEWLAKIKKQEWPSECIRCKETELLGHDSVRTHAIRFHEQQNKTDYLVVGGVLDNICNSGCLTCNEEHSTKIGSLLSKNYILLDNSNRFWDLPVSRIVKLDISGGEPSASKNYLDILKNIPENVKEIRINTNCGLIIEEVENLISKGIKVRITVSLDGIGKVHDEIRWPITWDKFYNNLMTYKKIEGVHIDTWTTVSALNIANYAEIKKFTLQNKLQHSYSLLHEPDELNVKYQNSYTIPYKKLFPNFVAIDKNNQESIDNFISKQKKLRNMN